MRTPKRRVRQRFPRTRGDGPLRNAKKCRRQRVPPHTRGWSPTSTEDGADGQGSPAHAGMVPSPSRNIVGAFRFPRTRGDGPSSSPCAGCPLRVPPHTRGWSLFDGEPFELGYGSPAHAGMVPHVCGRTASHIGFPRTRGDGPLECPARRPGTSVPPHTRGWSFSLAPAWPAARGSPAHAGMVPSGSAPARYP